MTYALYGGLRSRTLRVAWALEEMALDYRLIPAAPRSEEVTALNPSGKIPALQVDATTLTDSSAILTYLADHHAKLTFPAGTLKRAEQDGHFHFLLDEFDALLWTASKHSFALPEAQRVPAIKPSLKTEFQTSLSRLDARLKGPFLMGDTFTIADILAVHCLGWAISAKFPVDNPRLNDWAKSLRQRAAYKRAMARAD